MANAETPRTEAPISEADVAKVARLARLDIDDAHVHQFTEQLVKVLAHFRDIDALDLSAVSPMTQPYPLVNVMRDDTELPTLDTDEVLAAAPEAEERRFRVPPIIGLDG
ncbi:MAG: Asp-tRNA(Asn)/Glu-tRNA(Gln) amidotransferase subunit GatC [Actinomycetota bacterium]